MEDQTIIYAEGEEIGTIPEYKDIGVVYQRFIEWFQKNGGKMNGCQFPAYFGKDNIRGVVATREIKPNEALIFVPNSLLITTKLIQEDTIFGPIVEDHPSLFKDSVDWECNTQILFLMTEKAKGENSFWKPYLDTQPLIETPVEWDDADLDFIEDPVVKSEINNIKKMYNNSWEQFDQVLVIHPELVSKTPKKDFYWASQFVTSRNFGWYIPYTMLVPMIDMCNHDNRDLCTTEIMNLRQEKELNKDWLKEIDYRKLIKQYDMAYMIPEQNFVPSYKRHDMTHFLFNYQKLFKSTEQLPLNEITDLNTDEKSERLNFLINKLLRKSEMDIWDVPNVFKSDTENNDTESEDNEEEQKPKKCVTNYKDSCLGLNSKLKYLLKKPSKFTMKPKAFKEDEGKVDGLVKECVNTENLTVNYGGIVKQTTEDLILEKAKEITVEGVIEQAIQETYKPKSQENLKEEANTQDLEKIEKNSFRESEVTTISSKKVSKTELDNIESSSDESQDEQAIFPWYDHTDNDSYYVLANNHNVAIKKDKQICISYGKRCNTYLLYWYGFSLKYNIYDSLKFRISMGKLKSFEMKEAVFYKFQNKEKLEQAPNRKDLYQGYYEDPVTETKTYVTDLSKEFKSKNSCLNLDLLTFLRTAFSEMFQGKFKLDKTKTSRSKPENLELEKIVFENYIKLFENILSVYKRGFAEDTAQYDNEEVNWKNRMILNVEMNYKKIAHEQIIQAAIVLGIQNGLIKKDYRSIKDGYMILINKADEKLSQAQVIGKILKLKEYLKQLEKVHNVC